MYIINHGYIKLGGLRWADYGGWTVVGGLLVIIPSVPESVYIGEMTGHDRGTVQGTWIGRGGTGSYLRHVLAWPG